MSGLLATVFGMANPAAAQSYGYPSRPNDSPDCRPPELRTPREEKPPDESYLLTSPINYWNISPEGRSSGGCVMGVGGKIDAIGVVKNRSQECIGWAVRYYDQGVDHSVPQKLPYCISDRAYQLPMNTLPITYTDESVNSFLVNKILAHKSGKYTLWSNPPLGVELDVTADHGASVDYSSLKVGDVKVFIQYGYVPTIEVANPHDHKISVQYEDKGQFVTTDLDYKDSCRMEMDGRIEVLGFLTTRNLEWDDTRKKYEVLVRYTGPGNAIESQLGSVDCPDGTLFWIKPAKLEEAPPYYDPEPESVPAPANP